MFWQVSVVFVFLPIIGQGLNRGERCINQWGEKATCTNILSCKAAIDASAMALANGTKLYAAGIVCGFDDEALVCCRTPSDFDETSDNDIVPSDSGTTQSTLTSNDLNISTAVSPGVVQVALGLANNKDTTQSANRVPEISDEVTPDIDIRVNKRQTMATSTPSSSEEAIFTSPLVVAPISKSSTVPPPTTTSTTTTEQPKSTEIIDPLPLQSNSTTESPLVSVFPKFPDDSSTSVFPETMSSIVPTTTSRSTFTEPSVPTTKVFIDKVLPDRDMCGFQRKRNRIADAPIATIDEFPWMALLQYQDAFGYDVGFKCAGTLINNRYVITSAHCVAQGPEKFKVKSVRLGEWSIASQSDCVVDYNGEECPNKVINLRIEKVIRHPNSNNNIALLRLERKVKFTDFVHPICLPVEHLKAPSAGTILTTSGWGASKSGCLLDIKSKIPLTSLSKEQCSNNPFWFIRVQKDQICLNAVVRNDVCKTDSGGPLMQLDDVDKPQWYLEGVIPEGFYCDNRGYLGVYTRITNYIPWILFTLGQESN